MCKHLYKAINTIVIIDKTQQKSNYENNNMKWIHILIKIDN